MGKDGSEWWVPKLLREFYTLTATTVAGTVIALGETDVMSTNSRGGFRHVLHWPVIQPTRQPPSTTTTTPTGAAGDMGTSTRRLTYPLASSTSLRHSVTHSSLGRGVLFPPKRRTPRWRDSLSSGSNSSPRWQQRRAVGLDREIGDVETEYGQVVNIPVRRVHVI